MIYCSNIRNEVITYSTVPIRSQAQHLVFVECNLFCFAKHHKAISFLLKNNAIDAYTDGHLKTITKHQKLQNKQKRTLIYSEMLSSGFISSPWVVTSAKLSIRLNSAELQILFT